MGAELGRAAATGPSAHTCAESGAPAAGPAVAVTNLGCRVNRVELDAIALELQRAGCRIVDESAAELVVVNTCAVTGEAEAKARKAVRHAAALPQAPAVVATGCVASLFADELAGLAPNVVVEADKRAVGARALAELGWEARDAGAESAGGHAVTPTGRMRPGLKVQDGCDHRCTYCIVWKARGPARSLPAREVIDGVRALVAEGAREVVLTGIDLGRYDSDGLDLAGLLELVLAESEVGRVRLSSVEPAGVTPRLLEVMAGSGGRVAPFLHIPLQSGCDATLRRMGRPYDAVSYLDVVRRAREAVGGLAVACDLIVGFPGEDEREFAESLATCREASFAKMHVFRYSRRPGTPAAAMEGQVAPEVMAQRSRAMRELAHGMRRAYAASLVGTSQLVLVERAGRGVSGGLVDVLVDPGHEGELVRATPHAAGGDVLDARAMS